MQRGVSKCYRGAREQGCKECPVLIARGMINGSETAKLWGRCCFHQNHSTGDSPAETLPAATGEWQRDCSALLWHFSYCNPNKESRFATQNGEGEDKCSSVTQDLQWIINQNSKVKAQYLWLLQYIQDLSKCQYISTNEKKARRLRSFNGNHSRILGDIHFGACEFHVWVGSVIFF